MPFRDTDDTVTGGDIQIISFDATGGTFAECRNGEDTMEYRGNLNMDIM